MVTEQQLGVGNTPGNNLNCEDGQNGKMGSRKKPGNNNKTSGSSTPGNESPVNDLPFEQQAALLRILACQVQNPALLQSSQMAGILKQFKGNLNGWFNFYFNLDVYHVSPVLKRIFSIVQAKFRF